MNLSEQYAFRAGFALAMARIEAGDTDASWARAVRGDHTAAFADGYQAALDHYNEFETHGTDLARKMGLTAYYHDFMNGRDITHPMGAELPGHCLPGGAL